MKRTLWATALISSVLFFPLQARSFWSFVELARGTVHQEITTLALSEPFLVGTEPLKFEITAIDKLVISVQRPDDKSKMKYDPTDHFDSERFSQSLSSMKSRRAQLFEALNVDNPYGNQASAWINLGLIFHAAQDFYSHSTWVQGSGNGGIVNFGKLTRASGATIPPWKGNPTSIGGACDAAGLALLSGSGPLTSGYFEPNAREGANKCEHGTLPQWVSSCLSGVRWGIALDSWCVASKDLSAQRTAQKLAQQETRSLVEDLIAQLKEANNVQGICALLDVPLTKCPLALPACKSTANDIPPRWEYSFRYTIRQDGAQSVSSAGGQNGNLWIDVAGGTTPRLRLGTGEGLDAFKVSLSLRSTASYEDGITSYNLEAPGHELWNSSNLNGCLFAQFPSASMSRTQGCFAFSGTMRVVSKRPLCTRDGLMFSNMEVAYEGDSPIKEYGFRSLGPVKIDNSMAKGVFAECLRGVPTAIGAKGNDKFTCSAGEGTP